jgi:tripartite-type tricarboxylate transporter receptor subunit TctC
MIRILLACLAAGVLLLQPIPAGSQAYPERPIHIVVTFPPGGNADTMARLVADKLAQAVGQPVVVENKPGGATIVGTNAVVQAAADGYTLLQASTSLNTNPDLGQKTPYDAERDLLPVVNLVTIPAVLVINPALPANNLAEFIAYAKARPKEINYGSAGNGSFPHLAMEQLSQAADIKMTHVPFRGFGPAMVGLLRNDISALASDVPGALEHIRAGKLRALAVTANQRMAMLPDTPTVSEAGLRGYEAVGFLGFMVPAGTPRAVIASVNREVNRILQAPEIKNHVANNGLLGAGGTPDDFAAFLKGDKAKWSKVIAGGSIRAE